MSEQNAIVTPLHRDRAAVADDLVTPEGLGLRSKIVTTAQLEAMPSPEFIVDGYIPARSVCLLCGPPGTYKSFIAASLACSQASGRDWYDRATVPGRVLYQSGEGSAGFGIRVAAWRTSVGGDPADTNELLWLPTTVNLVGKKEADALVYAAADVWADFVTIDTLARATAGYDENSAGDMGLAIATAGRIRDACDAAVLIVHHSTKAGGVVRGSSALQGAVDVVLETKPITPTSVALKTIKQRDFPPANPMTLSFKPIGPSGVLVLQKGSGSTSPTAVKVLAFIRQYAGSSGVSSAQVQAGLNMAVTTFNTAKNGLVSGGVITNIGSTTATRWITSDRPAA